MSTPLHRRPASLQSRLRNALRAALGRASAPPALETSASPRPSSSAALPQASAPQRRGAAQEVTARLHAALQATEAAACEGEPALRNSNSGLWSEHCFEQLARRLEHELAGQPLELCLLCVELDGFDPLRERFGPQACEQLCLQVTQRLKRVTRDADLLFELPDCRFLLLLNCPPETGGDVVRAVATRLSADLERPFSYLTLSSLHLSPAIGSARWPADAQGLADVLELAFAAQREARLAGSGQARHHVAPPR